MEQSNLRKSNTDEERQPAIAHISEHDDPQNLALCGAGSGLLVRGDIAMDIGICSTCNALHYNKFGRFWQR